MQDKLERLIKVAYKKYKGDTPKPKTHPDEETIACFLEDRLSKEESQLIKTHIVNCHSCAQYLAVQIKLKLADIEKVPDELIDRVKNLLDQEAKIPVLEIFLRLKEKALEVLKSTGDILVGQEFVPAPVLRSRNIKDFPDTVTILKDFKNLRVEAKIENKQGKSFGLTITVIEKESQKVMKDLRVTLIKDDLELESYVTDLGKVTFENVLLGRYTVEISTVQDKLATILLDISPSQNSFRAADYTDF